MKELKIGVDIDGVLADFNYGLKNVLWEITGERLISLSEEPKCWNWPTAYGYTQEHEDEAWRRIKANPTFWAGLQPFPFVPEQLVELAHARLAGHEVYFITTRTGIAPHLQTVYWLHANGFSTPTVLISTNGDGKANIAKGLRLTHMIDDKPENVLKIKKARPECSVTMLNRRWNQEAQGECAKRDITVRSTVAEFLQEVYDAQS